MGIKRETEESFQCVVRALARMHGWLCYHTRDSRRSPDGFPDLVLVKGSRLVVAELKSAKGKTTAAQGAWLEAFRATGAEVFVWKPSDWPMIQQVLGGQRP